MLIPRTLAALLLGCATTLAPAADPVIYFDQANPPFMYSKDGKASGVYPAIVAAAFRKMNAPVRIESVPWSRALAEIEQGQGGVGGIYKTAERERKFDYSAQIHSERIVVFFHKAKPLNFAKVDDLKGLKVGVIRSWSYGEAFDSARRGGLFTAEEVASDDQNFSKLSAQRLDAVVAVAEAGAAMLAAHPAVAAAPTPLSEAPTFVAFAKSANQAELLKRFNQAMQEMRTGGELDRIVKSALH